jgi:hypothetical protein
VYLTGSEVVPVGANVIFSGTGVLSPGIIHVQPVGVITVTTAGTYELTFMTRSTGSSKFGVTVNGLVVPGSVHGGNGAVFPLEGSVGQIIVNLAAADAVSIQNEHVVPVTLSAPDGDSAYTNASLVIRRLN